MSNVRSLQVSPNGSAIYGFVACHTLQSASPPHATGTLWPKGPLFPPRVLGSICLYGSCREGKTQVTFDWEILGSAKQFKTYYQNQGFIRFD